MSKITSPKAIAGGALLVGLLAGVAGAQVFEAVAAQLQILNTGLFKVALEEEVTFSVSHTDVRSRQPVRVLLQLFDEAGASAARHEAVLQAGESTSLAFARPGSYRAQARIVSALQFAAPHVSGTVEVGNLVTPSRRPVCSIIDQQGLPPGR
jgi:hypothetical protein